MTTATVAEFFLTPGAFEIPNKATITGLSVTELAMTASTGVFAAEWDEINRLLSLHLERFDSLYRRLA